MPQTVKILVTMTVKPAPPPPVFSGPIQAATTKVAVEGERFEEQIAQVEGGVPPYGQPNLGSESRHPIPPGIKASIDPQTGVVTISGTPEQPGTTQFLLDIADSTKN